MATLRFWLGIAAAYADPNLSIRGLAIASGVSVGYLGNIWRGTQPMTIKVAMAIEQTVGRDVVSRADLLPEIFGYDSNPEVSNVE